MDTLQHRPLVPGEIIAGLKIVERLGAGRQSTVWRVHNQAADVGGTSPNLALKVYRSGGKRIEPYLNELHIFRRIADAGGHENVLGFRGTIIDLHMADQCRPSIHPCVIFDLGQKSLHELIVEHTEATERGIPLGKSKNIIRQIFRGLEFLHRCGITHTDVKPENILVRELEGIHVCLADFDGAVLDGVTTQKYPGTRPYMAPELIVDATYDHTIDIWAAFATAYEVVTGDLMFDIFDEYSIMYGEDVDKKSDDEMLSEEDKPASSESSEEESGDLTSVESIDEDATAQYHLLLIAKVLGFPPEAVRVQAGPGHYDSHGKPISCPDVIPISIFDLLMLNYDLPSEVSQGFHEFLSTGLRYRPCDRITAQAAAEHEWCNFTE